MDNVRTLLQTAFDNSDSYIMDHYWAGQTNVVFTYAGENFYPDDYENDEEFVADVMDTVDLYS